MAEKLEGEIEATNAAPAIEASSSLKRKQSPEPDADDSIKKRRLSTDAEVPVTTAAESKDETRTNGQTSATAREAEKEKLDGSKPNSATQTEPEPAPVEPSAQNSASKQPIDERKRGKRLFGAVFGALGHTTPGQLAKRREIERKQREKLRAQAEEDDAAREERLAKLRGARMQEQQKFDRQSTSLRHSNMLAMANSLHTKTEPRIYWRPWELLPEEEDEIRRQVQEAEDVIEKERDDAERDDLDEQGRTTVTGGDGDGSRRDSVPDEQSAKNRTEEDDVTMEDPSTSKDAPSAEQNRPLHDVNEPTLQNGSNGKADSEMRDLATHTEAESPRKDDIDEGAEDIHGEDAVIY